jgi:Fic family protein
MAAAVKRINPGELITLDLLLDFHRRLLARTRLGAHAGAIREEQNWIGGSSYNPRSAAFVPPPPEYLSGLLEDLCQFCNSDDIPAVAQAAIAHAQFETIHSFVDGNGRTGRALIHLVLRRRGLATRVLPPVSLVLATWALTEIARAANGLGHFRSAERTRSNQMASRVPATRGPRRAGPGRARRSRRVPRTGPKRAAGPRRRREAHGRWPGRCTRSR